MPKAGRLRRLLGAPATDPWWSRTLRLPPAVVASSVALRYASASAGGPLHLDPYGVAAAAALWIGLIAAPDGGLAGRVLWPVVALGLGAAQVTAAGAALVPMLVVLPLLAALPLSPATGLALLAIAGGVLAEQGLAIGAAAPWAITAWALITASVLLRQLATERQRTTALLRHCADAVTAEEDGDALRAVQALAAAKQVAVLRSDGQSTGATARAVPFIWLQRGAVRTERVYLAPGLTPWPAEFPVERAAVADMALATGSKLFLIGDAPLAPERLADVARLAGLREAHRWMTARLRDADYNALESLVRALDARDPYTRGHSERVARFAVSVGQELGLTAELLDALQRGGMLHDIGKIGVPEHILNKPDRLTSDEYAIMQRHVRIGVEIIDAVNSSIRVLEVVSGHHEHHNGTGYPYGLRGEQIPLLARIAHVADSFEAMTSARSYNQPRSLRDGLAELRRCAGVQFHPEIVEAFCAVVGREAGGYRRATERGTA